MKTKICATCKEEKPLDEFYRRSDTEDNRTYSCGSCTLKRRPKYSQVKSKRVADYQDYVGMTWMNGDIGIYYMLCIALISEICG